MDDLALEAVRRAIFDAPLPRPHSLAIFATPAEAEQLLRRLPTTPIPPTPSKNDA